MHHRVSVVAVRPALAMTTPAPDSHYLLPPANAIWPCTIAEAAHVAPWCDHTACFEPTGADALAAIFRTFPDTEVIE